MYFFSTPLESCYFLYLFLDFIIRNQRSEILNTHFPLRRERRECILNSTPLESCYIFCTCFWISLFETRESLFISFYDEKEGNVF